MSNIFRFDSKFAQIMSKVADCLTLSVMWILFCTPVITAGAATTALYYTAVKVLREDAGSPVKDFWHAFKTNFKQSTLVMVGAIILLLLWGVICYAVSGLPGISLTNAYIVYFGVLALGVMWLHYIFSYIARFQDKLGTILKNTLIICAGNFPYSLLVITMFVIILLLLAVNLPNSLWALLLLPAVYMVLVSLILEPVYSKYLPAAEDAEDEEEEET